MSRHKPLGSWRITAANDRDTLPSMSSQNMTSASPESFRLSSSKPPSLNRKAATTSSGRHSWSSLPEECVGTFPYEPCLAPSALVAMMAFPRPTNPATPSSCWASKASLRRLFSPPSRCASSWAASASRCGRALPAPPWNSADVSKRWIPDRSTYFCPSRAVLKSAHHVCKKRSAMILNHGDHNRISAAALASTPDMAAFRSDCAIHLKAWTSSGSGFIVNVSLGLSWYNNKWSISCSPQGAFGP
mmetsp:Transcript_70537/g.216095  ORF Transcript_70537/g.216095 Transcript_70537/m.216095 type:complete len:245 (-) Transcript_70537:528-1262(-)